MELKRALQQQWQAGQANLKRFGYLPDCIVLGVICLLFIARCALRGGGVMWFDELLSFNLIHDPSVIHMLAALGDQADGAPPAYYLLGKVWAMVFSGDPASLRMFSTFGFCVGFALLWSAMRHAFSFFPTAVAFAVTLGLNETIRFESSNLRFYGLLFALISLVILLGVKLCHSERSNGYLLALNAAAQGMLVLSHPLGGFYGAALLFAVGISDLLAPHSRVRLKVFASYCIGWLAIFLWWPQFFRQGAINQPHGWIPVPLVGDLFSHFLQQSLAFPLLLIQSVCWLGSIAVARASSTPSKSFPFQLSWPQCVQFVIALSMIAVAPLFWIISRAFPSNAIFLPRYLIGTTFGWTVLLALLVTYVFEHNIFRSPRFLQGVAVLLSLTALGPLCAPLIARLSGKSTPDGRAFLTGSSDRAFGHLELPIVCPDGKAFLARTHYAADAARYYYLLNWEPADTQESLPDAAVNRHLLSAIKRHYLESPNIIDRSEFLRSHPAFLVLDVPKCSWCFLNFRSNAYKITRLMAHPPISYDHEGEWPLLLVEKRP